MAEDVAQTPKQLNPAALPTASIWNNENYLSNAGLSASVPANKLLR